MPTASSTRRAGSGSGCARSMARPAWSTPWWRSTSPLLSPDGRSLAFLCWNHPNMPWVGTELYEAAFAADGGLGPARLVAGGAAESIFQPEYSPDGVLYFVSDRSGWWNLYRDGASRPLCPRAAEFGQAQWIFGQSTYAFLDAGRLVCTYREGGRSTLARLDLARGRLDPIALPYTEFGSVRTAHGRVLCLAGAPSEPGAAIRVDPDSGAVDILRQSAADTVTPELRRYFAAPQHLT